LQNLLFLFNRSDLSVYDRDDKFCVRLKPYNNALCFGFAEYDAKCTSNFWAHFPLAGKSFPSTAISLVCDRV